MGKVVNSDKLLEIEFDENSLRGVLDKNHWYPTVIAEEYSCLCKWNCEEAKLPRMNNKH